MFLFELVDKNQSFRFLKGKNIYSKAVMNGDRKTIRVERTKGGKVISFYVNPKKLVVIV